MKVDKAYKYSQFGVYGIVILLFILLFMAFYPFKVSDIHSLRVINDPVVRGEPLMLEIFYSKYRDVKVRTTRTISCDDGNLVTLTGGNVVLPLDNEGIVIIEGPVLPKKTSLGWCTYNINATYHINALNERTKNIESEPFLVIE